LVAWPADNQHATPIPDKLNPNRRNREVAAFIVPTSPSSITSFSYQVDHKSGLRDPRAGISQAALTCVYHRLKSIGRGRGKPLSTAERISNFTVEASEPLLRIGAIIDLKSTGVKNAPSASKHVEFHATLSDPHETREAARLHIRIEPNRTRIFGGRADNPADRAAGKTAAGLRDLAGITPIVLLGRVDGAQHQRMRHLHLLRVRKSTIVDRVGENRC
jgi:hypothetical protein